MRAIVLLVIGLLGFAGAQGQVLQRVDTIAFSGVVLNERDMSPLPNATCRLGEGKGTATGEDVGFRPCTVVVPDTLFGNEYIVGVFMSPDTLQLSEALVMRRWGDASQEDMLRARNNMRGILKQAFDPNRPMDADMNQRRMIEEYAHSVEMKGHVDVGFGIGTQSLAAYRLLRLQKRIREREEGLVPEEIDLLKKIYYSEKRKNLAD